MRFDYLPKNIYISRTNFKSANGKTILAMGCFLLYLFSSLMTVIAQPSGGPYGPIQQTYKLPKVSGKIYYVATDGQAKAIGETLDKPTTLEAAIERVKTG